MKVVLKVNVPKLGEVGQVVKVRDGYARNFLVPQGMAVPYTEKTKKSVDHVMKQQRQKVTRKEQQYQALLDRSRGSPWPSGKRPVKTGNCSVPSLPLRSSKR